MTPAEERTIRVAVATLVAEGAADRPMVAAYVSLLTEVDRLRAERDSWRNMFETLDEQREDPACVRADERRTIVDRLRDMAERGHPEALGAAEIVEGIADEIEGAR